MHQNYQYSIAQINEKQQQKTTTKTTTTTNKQKPVGSMKMHKEVGYDRMTGAS